MTNHRRFLCCASLGVIACSLSCAAGATALSETRCAVFLDARAPADFAPAAEAFARQHGVQVETFDPRAIDALRDRLRTMSASERPTHAAFVVAPTSLDVQFAQDLLAALCALDEDPFVDLSYAFITGKDGASAQAFVERIALAKRREPTGRATLFGSWEGQTLPPAQPLSALKALGLTGTQHFVLTTADDETRRATSRAALAQASDADLLLLFSHGSPTSMERCFSGREIREWKPALPPSVLINCACWNGVTGRWWNEGPTGPIEQPPVAAEESVALALLDSGCGAYVAGLDPWHGPLAMRYAFELLDSGRSIGDAAKETFDRLTLEFAPNPIAFRPIAASAPRAEGTDNRRRNSAAIVVFGDPTWAPFASRAPKRLLAERGMTPEGSERVTFTIKPLLQGQPAQDFMLPLGRLGDYHSVRGNDWATESALEVVRAIDWPEPLPKAPRFRVAHALMRDQPLPCGEVQSLLEVTPTGRRLHIRVPITVRAVGSMWPMAIAASGATIVVEMEREAGGSSK